MRVIVLAIVLVVTAGCVSAYTEPPSSANSATITFVRNASVPRWGYTQILQIVSDEKCASRNRLKDFVPLGSQEPHSFRVEGGARKFFMAETIYTQGGAHGFSDKSCSNVASFVPEPGRAYRLTHAYGPQACGVTIVDEATGAAPATFVAHPFDRACISVW